MESNGGCFRHFDLVKLQIRTDHLTPVTCKAEKQRTWPPKQRHTIRIDARAHGAHQLPIRRYINPLNALLHQTHSSSINIPIQCIRCNFSFIPCTESKFHSISSQLGHIPRRCSFQTHSLQPLSAHKNSCKTQIRKIQN